MKSMAGEINKLIPLYGELNRIYNDWITNYAFSFDKQKFITDFYRQHNDTKAFESAILELVLDKQKEQYTLILNSLKIGDEFLLVKRKSIIGHPIIIYPVEFSV